MTATVDFATAADPFRRELLAHCYRMLGSLHDAEDLVQETYLRAWKAYGKFEGRSSVRTWLYRIATNVCLTALDGRTRRPLPFGLGTQGATETDPLTQDHEIPWLEPFPTDPAAIVTERESTRLAFVAALQHLPPRQRAVLILRDVLKLSAAETADELDMTVAAVNSALQRAHAQLKDLSEDEIVEPADAKQLLDRWVKAFEAKDIPAIIGMFAEDVIWEMPPYPQFYRGPDMVAWHLTNQCPSVPHGARMIATEANGQPAFGLYLRAEDGVFRPFNLQVVEASDRITRVSSFFDLSLFPKFGLPSTA
ncbi:sigma-70 family RNA polymerase sigma factor [Lentzea sp. NBC_00516]|uniref:sigma-70 family RNA polymerase sigma factor n=1 Tax=Lentzea sp. NBC_00516 TaxID=2903582 RepID=UPI002E8121C0|nr:sigma-70 family RNA polymerase sigma factor [Lentzea sp. NBC_00516]WUD25334.1 sigma-70 family RNA polymerase sigma factor [Lentzea sp. NBC_00516]